jgi:hypothetical protein
MKLQIIAILFVNYMSLVRNFMYFTSDDSDEFQNCDPL